MEVHKLLRQQRVAKGLTQKNVADYLGMTHSGYSKYERGERKISLDLIEKLSPILNLSFVMYDDLVTRVQVTLYQRFEDFSEQILSRESQITTEEKSEIVEIEKEIKN